MRSVVLPLTHQCVYSDKCNFCLHLGYRRRASLSTQGSDKSIDQNENDQNINDLVNKKIESLSGAIAKTIVLPCGSNFLTDAEPIRNKLIYAGYNVNSLVHFYYWDSLAQLDKDKIDQTHNAVVFSDFKQMLSKNLPKKAAFFFVVNKKNWNLKKWENLAEEIKTQIKLFFPGNVLGHRHFFSAEELYKEFSELQKRYPACFVGTPFGHDLVDIRNDIHLNWNFSESPKWQSYEDVHPKVSVIIPVYNRKEFLMKIISSLSDQTLSQHEFEVLILDDGGTDQLEEELVKECGKKSISNIKYYYLPRDIELTSEYIGNRVGPIRNFGASQARSEILLFLDSDILLERDYLDKIMLAHKNADVVLPKRVYLSKEVTQNILSSSSKYKFDSKDELITPWQGYLDDFYNSGNWQIHGTPWKYFMTYCLSIQKSLFIKAGGFRTNYISYGYEDLDLGYRIIKLNPKLQFLVEKVYHLYHFDQKSSEYGMIKAFRKFQLAMTSRTFVAQNQTFQIEYLRNMTILDQWIQYPIFFWFLLRWKLRRIKMYSFFNNFIHPKKNFYNFNE